MFRGNVDRFNGKYFITLEAYNEGTEVWDIVYTTSPIFDTWEEATKEIDLEVEKCNKDYENERRRK